MAERNLLLERVGTEVSDYMDKIKRRFKPGARITVLVRRPGYPEQDFVMTDDEIEGAIACLLRRRDAGPSS